LPFPFAFEAENCTCTEFPDCSSHFRQLSLNSKYFVDRDEHKVTTWDGAIARCHSYGLVLAEIRSIAEQMEIAQLIRGQK